MIMLRLLLRDGHQFLIAAATLSVDQKPLVIIAIVSAVVMNSQRQLILPLLRRCEWWRIIDWQLGSVSNKLSCLSSILRRLLL